MKLALMLLNHGLHLGYCTNIHRGESWEETWRGLRDYTLRVRERVAKGRAYGIGLRLSERAARELAEPAALAAFQRWLEEHDCYVFTINGFPYGSFHGTRVKEEVFKPDWSKKERLDYTLLLFDLLAKLLPAGASGSVSTLPGSHKRIRYWAGRTGRHLCKFTDLLGTYSAGLANPATMICIWGWSRSHSDSLRRVGRR